MNIPSIQANPKTPRAASTQSLMCPVIGHRLVRLERGAVLVGVYAGIVTLTTKTLGFHTPLAVAASTLVAVALFNPLRVRVQRIVDRRFNRARYDAEATVAAFTARLRDAVDLETVRSELVEVVNQAVEPAHASGVDQAAALLLKERILSDTNASGERSPGH